MNVVTLNKIQGAKLSEAPAAPFQRPNDAWIGAQRLEGLRLGDVGLRALQFRGLGGWGFRALEVAGTEVLCASTVRTALGPLYWAALQKNGKYTDNKESLGSKHGTQELLSPPHVDA